MENINIIAIGFLGLGILFMSMGFLILKKKDLRFIPNMTYKKSKRLKNKNKLFKDYSKRIFVMGIACVFTGICMIGEWGIGIYTGGILMLIAAIFMGRFNSEIDKKIEEKIY